MTELDLHELDLGVMAGRWLKDLTENPASVDFLRSRWPDLTSEDFEAALAKMRDYVDAFAPGAEVGAAAIGRLHRRWQDSLPARDRVPAP